jgi:hypothetical protein
VSSVLFLCRGGKAIEERLRAAVQDVYRCDVLLDNPLSPLPLQTFDCVIVAGVIEVAAHDQETYLKCVDNVKRLLNPGALLLVDGDLGCSYYVVDGKKFHVLKSDASFIRSAYEQKGFEKVHMTMEGRNYDVEKGIEMFDSQGYFHLIAHHPY